MTAPRAALAIIAVSTLTLAGALAFQYVGGLAPCTLCHWQRYPYVIEIGIGALMLSLGRDASVLPAQRSLLALSAVVFLAGTGVAGFHVGVEHAWWQGLQSCGGQIEGASLSINALRALLLNTGVVRCDQVPWQLFGLSLAGFNFLLSLAFSAMAGFGTWRLTAAVRSASMDR